MTVKVNKESLVVAIQAKRAEVIADHAKQVKASAGDFTKYKQSVVTKLQEFLAIARAAKSADEIGKTLKYNHCLELPAAPREVGEANTKKYDRALAQLSLV